MTKEIQRFSDEAMFVAENISEHGPRVTLINGTRDPLGVIAQKTKAYQGKFPRSLREISDDDRLYYLDDVRKNVLGSPLECVQFEFLIEGVTRGFTHQLVRQRVGAAYQQESMRFAVKEDFPVALPPSLENTTGEMQAIKDDIMSRCPNWPGPRLVDPDSWDEAQKEWQFRSSRLSKEEKWRGVWDKTIEHASRSYNQLVDDGMPAEDARGLAPTNILTKINYTTSLRGLIDHAGLRLCTQAQYEWKRVWIEMLKAIRTYAKEDRFYHVNNAEMVQPGVVYEKIGTASGHEIVEVDESWQWEALAEVFKPICYKTGKCEFMSDFDRYCPIRETVEANHKIGRPSSEWEKEFFVDNAATCGPNGEGYTAIDIDPIRPAQWLDPRAAIRGTGDWRSKEAQDNIKDRR